MGDHQFVLSGNRRQRSAGDFHVSALRFDVHTLAPRPQCATTQSEHDSHVQILTRSKV
jgi:hypothetical protein